MKSNYLLFEKEKVESREHQFRKNINKGTKVKIIEKNKQGTDDYTTGVVKDILTKKKNHSRGIKVRLETGEVGRVQEILE